MVTSLVVTFREFLEMFLILVPLLVYLKKADKTSLSKFVYGGALTGGLASFIIGILIYNQVHSLDFAVQGIFSGSMQMFLAALILYSMVIINKQQKDIDIEGNNFKGTTTALGLFILAFITIFRECLEIILFLIPLFLENAGPILIGGISGVMLALLLMVVIYRTSLKLNIKLIFTLITLVLIALGSFMFGEALAEFFPNQGDAIEKAGILIYGLPTLLIFLKKNLKSLIK